jgi:hypothetical protein
MSLTKKDIQWLPTGSLTIDRRVQRQSLNANHVKSMAEGFDPDAFGTLTVSKRDDGSYAVLDGQHRLKVLETLGFNGKQKVPCDVRTGLTLSQEAALFRMMNTSQKPMVVDRFLVRAVEGDPVVVDILKIVEGLGWKVAGQKADGYIAAADVLERLYTGRGMRHSEAGNDPAAFEATLSIITRAWGHNSRGVSGLVIGGIGAVVRRDLKKIDQVALVQRFAQLEGGPDRIIGMGRSVTAGSHRGVQVGISWAVVSIHNRGRRTRVLDPWPL